MARNDCKEIEPFIKVQFINSFLHSTGDLESQRAAESLAE